MTLENIEGGRFQISDNVIIGDGIDEVLVTVYGMPNELAHIKIVVGDTQQDMQIQLSADGVGAQNFSCDTPKVVINFSYGGETLKVRAL